MKKNRSWLPDYYFDDISSVTPELLTQNGVKAILIDIDNTLVPYEIAEPTEFVRSWLDAVRKAGVKPALVSNNHRERVELFNRSLGLPAFPDSGKPLKKACLRALKELNCSPNEAAVLGDQIFTDVLAGRNAGIPVAFLVKPIKDKTNLFFQTKRLLEKPLLAAYRRREKKKRMKGENA